MADGAHELTVGRAEGGDLPAIAAIYGFHVLHSASSFELNRGRWRAGGGPRGAGRRARPPPARGPRAGAVVGWVKSGAFRDRAAYHSSVETACTWPPRRRPRRGRALYAELLRLLADAPAHRAYAGITQPNPASVALHLRHGFSHIGTFTEVGRKFDRWWDVAWYERPLHG